MWTLIGLCLAVMLASAIFVLREDEHDHRPDFFKRRDRPF